MIEMQKKTYKVYSKGSEYIVIHRDYKEKAAEAKAEMKTAMAELKELGDKHFEYARYLDKKEKINAQQILDKIVTFNYVMNDIIDFIENYVGDAKEFDKKIAKIETNTVNSAYRILTDHLMEHRIEHEQELEDAEVEVNAAQISGRNIIVITTIIIFVLAIIIGYAISIIITKPINILKENAEKLGKGNLDARIEIISKNEIGELATSFNLMAKDLEQLSSAEKEKSDALQKLKEKLEIKVKERTAELEEKNKKLEKFQQSLALLLDDVNESRAKLDTTNKKLETANKELEAFSYSVSHDLRAPLRHIDGFTKLLNKKIRNIIDEKAQNYFDNITNSSKQMNQLIDDLLIFSRMGRKDIKKTKNNMKTIINEARETFDLDIKENKISVIVDDMPEVNLDAAMIRQVWENLIANAIKFTGNEKNPEIHIGTEKDADGKTIFFIKDNGVGFDQKYVDKIFGVFQRLHNINEFPGTGIGLANVKRIIRKHGGDIRAEGKVNKGASLFFTLPDA